MWEEVHQLKSTIINLETIKKREEEDKVFLRGLSSDYESIRSSIMMMEPLPTLNSTYAILH